MNKGIKTDKKQDTMVAWEQVAGTSFDEQVQSSFDQSMMVHNDDGQWNCEKKVPLPLGYSPSPQCVVIGRGGHTMGRSRLRMIAAQFLEPYSEANTKVAKSAIVSKIIKMTEEGCPYGAFVKFTDGRWWQVGSSKAREKVGYVLRDLLHDKYRSSSQSKAAARRLRAQEKRNNRTSPCSFLERSSSESSSVSNSDVVPLSMKSNGGMNHRVGTTSRPNLPTSLATLPTAAFDCSATCDDYSNRITTPSITRVFGQKDDPFEPVSFSPDTSNMPLPIHDAVPSQYYNDLASKATATNTSGNPAQLMDSLDIVEMKGNPLQVPVGEELSSVFD